MGKEQVSVILRSTFPKEEFGSIHAWIIKDCVWQGAPTVVV